MRVVRVLMSWVAKKNQQPDSPVLGINKHHKHHTNIRLFINN